MKKNIIRSLALLGAMAVTASSAVLSGKVSGSNAVYSTSEWTVYSGADKQFDVAEGLTVCVENAGVDLTGSTAKIDDLSLYVKFYIKNQDALDSFKASGCVELAQDTYDKSELNWLLSDRELHIGDNELEFNLSEAYSQCIDDSDYFNIKKPINWFRIFSTTDAKTGQELYTKTDYAMLKEVKLRDNRTAGLNFGTGKTSDTYLQLSSPLKSVPQTIEASVKQNPIKTQWSLLHGIGDAVEASAVPDTENGPGDVRYYKVDAGKRVSIGLSTELGIDTGKFTLNDLVLSFWCYNGSTAAEKLGTNGEQLRISSNKSNVAGNALYYPMADITLNPGWNHIQLKLSDWPQWIMGSFSVKDIQSFGIDTESYTNGSSSTRYFSDFELSTLNKEISSVEWQLGSSIGSPKDYLTSGPGNDAIYYSISAGTTVSVPLATNLNINAGKFNMNQLALSFWCYNSSDTAEKLGNDGEQIRISSNKDHISNNALYYPMADITLNPGWNHIQLKLSDWPQWIMGDFSVSNIQSFGIDTGTYKNFSASLRYFTDFELVALNDTNTKYLLSKGIGNEITYTTGSTDTPGSGLVCTKVSAGDTVPVTLNTNLGINAGKYNMDELALSFWCYSGSTVAEKLGDNGEQLRISSNESNVAGNALYYPMADITVNPGWNHIKLKLSDWPQWIMGDFSLSNIQSFGIDVEKYTNNGSAVRYFSDFKLEMINKSRPDDVKIEVTDNIDSNSLADNYMIFSNSSAANEDNIYALYLTSKGYPALLYGKKQFVLTKSVATGDWKDIAVVRNSDKTVSFYIDGAFIAKSNEKTENIGKFNTAHCIGADGKGNQVMFGEIADIRLWSDSRTAEEISSSRVSKNPGVISNGLNAETNGLIGGWFLVGDIQYVLESMPDISKYSNTAVYRGSRADDWSDYTIPSEIGDDYWSLVFVPDIQNLTNADDYNETWKSMAQWIADNIDKENIKHVISAGDSTWGNNDEQYTRAMKGFNKFNNLVSWSNMIGNHDYVWNASDRNSEKYREYFGESQIKNSATAETYVGCFDDPAGKTTTENSYYRFVVNGKKWMIVQLEYHPRMSVLTWAKNIIDSYSTDNVILTTHSYLDGYGDYANDAYMNYINESTDNASGGYIGDTTAEVWNVLKQCGNIKMILCGHSTNGTGAVVEKNETNSDGTTVPVLMINAQDADAGEGFRDGAAYYSNSPLGMLGIFRFSKDGSKVVLQYYSPAFNKSFSPEFNGESNSNSLKFGLSVLNCAHINTTVKVNENAATATTNGYTGDIFCTDCQEFIKLGKIIPASGGKNSPDSDGNNSNSSDIDSDADSNKTSPSTGDYIRYSMYVVFTVMLISGVVAVVTRRVLKRERKAR